MTYKTYIILLVLPITLACSEEAHETNLKNEQQEITVNRESIAGKNDTKKNETVDTGDAQEWLEQAVNHYFSQELNDRKDITTSAYDEYKSDMINSVYSHGMELDSLKKKWSHKYQVNAKITGVGFLIGAQDYYKITIDSCTLLSLESSHEMIFKLVLCDAGYDQCYTSDVTVIKQDDSYAIDNVKEYFR